MQRMDRSPGTLNLGSWIGCGSGDKIGGGITFTHSSSPLWALSFSPNKLLARIFYESVRARGIHTVLCIASKEPAVSIQYY